MVVQHTDMEEYLGRYCGLMLYLKEMDEPTYGRLCAVSVFSYFSLFLTGAEYRLTGYISLQAYFSAASELHSAQIKALFNAYLGYVKRASEDDGELGKSAAT